MAKRIEQYIKTWEERCYSEGLPDEGPNEIFEKVPSYKKIALAILTNDHALETLGFTVRKLEIYNQLKKIEFAERRRNYRKT